MLNMLHLFTSATPQEVWRALTAPELIARYLYGMAAASTWRPGAPLRLTADGSVLEGEVLAAVEPNRLSYSVQAGAGQPSTYVTWEVWGAGRGSFVRLYVDEPDDLTSGGAGEEAAAAWTQVLAGLEEVLAPAPSERLAPQSR